MNTYTLTPEERFNLILECRNSGLTDYQWCKQKGISTNTLYRWINKFRQNGYPNIPKAKGKSQIASAKQEVVKLDIVADIPCETSGYNFCENNGQEDGPDVFYLLHNIITNFRNLHLQKTDISSIDDIIIGMYARGLTYDKTDFGSD